MHEGELYEGKWLVGDHYNEQRSDRHKREEREKETMNRKLRIQEKSVPKATTTQEGDRPRTKRGPAWRRRESLD